MLAPKQKDTLTLAALVDLHHTLAELSVEERCAQYQLKPDRADVIVPALKIYITALEALGQQTLLVPKIGLSDGVIYQLYLQHSNL
jgi:exopolyphosphatase/guanosine-5'-triphosphate,3'-diphosphate pyrophosphatase